MEHPTFKQTVIGHLLFYAAIIAVCTVFITLVNQPVVGYDQAGNCVYVEHQGGRMKCPEQLPKFHHSEIVAANYWEKAGVK